MADETVPQSDREVSLEAFTTAYWWGGRLRHRLTMENPWPEAAGHALNAGELDIAAAAIAGVSIFDQLKVIEWRKANLTEARVRTFEAALARLIDEGLAASQPRSLVHIENDYEPDPLLTEAARQSGWAAGVTIFERGSGSLTLPGRVTAGIWANEEELPLVNDYPDPDQ